MVHDALVFVTEFEQREELTTTRDLKVLADEVKVLGRRDLREGLRLRSSVHYKLHKLALLRRLPCCKLRGTDMDQHIQGNP